MKRIGTYLTALLSAVLLLTAFGVPSAAPLLTAEAAVSTDSEQTVYEALLAMKSNRKYAQGARYDNNYPYSNSSPYVWEAAKLRCAGCAAFAAELSDAVFGKTMPVRTYQNISEVRSGDVLRYQLKTGEHSVIVLRKLSDSVEVAEGNNGGKVYWGRTIPFSELQSSRLYFYTRYPDTSRGDTDGNGVVSAEDAQLVLKAYTRRVSGQSMGLTQEQITRGDADKNNVISVEDAQLILVYYTRNTVSGQNVSWEQLLR